MSRIANFAVSILLLSASSPVAAKVVSSELTGRLEAKAIERGSVRVIVQLATEHASEGLLSLAQIGQQRMGIHQIQDRVLADVGPSGALDSTRFETIPFMGLVVDAQALDRLLALPEVVGISEDRVHRPSLDRSIPLIGADVAASEGFTGSGQAVAILDTGVDKSHSFFGGRVVSEACFSTTDPAEDAESTCPNGQDSQIGPGAGVPCDIGPESGCGHGTHVAGIAAGSSASLRGVAPAAKIVAIQVFHKSTSSESCDSNPPCTLAFDSDIIGGLERVQTLASSLNIAAANMSLGSGEFSSPCDGVSPGMRAIVDSLYSRGVATVVASGNEGHTNAISFPACISKAIAVGASGDFDTVWTESNSSTLIDLLAPGIFINSSIPGGGFASFRGTSMAAPHVAGAWALLKQKIPSASVAQVESALESPGVLVTDLKNGVVKPRIQVDAALDALSASLSPPSQLAASLEGLIAELTWRDNSNNEEGFRVYRSLDGEESEVLAEVEANATSYSDETLETGHSYAYQVTSFTALLESRLSNTATVATDCTPPAAPTEIFAAPTSASAIQVDWMDNSSDEAGFQIEIAADGSGAWAVAATTGPDATTTELTALVPDTEYAVRVAAMGACLSSYDETRTWTPADDDSVPTAPDQLLAILGDGFATLTWRDNSNNELEFLVERRVMDPQGPFEVVARLPIDNSTVTPSVDIEEQMPGVDYEFQVQARGVGGASSYSSSATIETPAPGDVCTPSSSRACVDSSRFRVDVAWRALNRRDDQGVSGAPIAVQNLGELSTSFAFFDPDKTELILKVLDGSGINERYWVFYGALSDVEYWISVTDTDTANVVTYYNEQGNICGLADTGALPGDPAPTSPASTIEAISASFVSTLETGTCVEDASTLCLQDDRFQVQVTWSNPLGESGTGTAVPDNDTTGFFWFKNANNTELAVKIADGTPINGRFWVFYGALTNISYEVTVTDTVAGISKTYVNEQGNVCGIADTDAF